MTELEWKAFAKVNIGLDVIKRLENGYHEVCMIMQTISLYDTVYLKKCPQKGIFLTVNVDGLGEIEDNLAYRAAKLLLEQCEISQGIEIDLRKKIPAAAGLAGGSADAAAVLCGLNRLFETNLTVHQLMELGIQLGADVPYCIMGGTCLAQGIGEKLTRLPAMPDCYVLIAKPSASVSTKWVYENLQLNEQTVHPNISSMIQCIQEGDLKGLSLQMGNVLEPVTVTKHPVIRSIEERMEQLGARKAMMSGSGPTVFGLFDTQEEMHRAYEALHAADAALVLHETQTISNINSKRDGYDSGTA